MSLGIRAGLGRLFGALGITLSVAGLCWGQPAEPHSNSIKIASGLKAVTLTGQPVDIAAQKGWRVIYFWSLTCPCVRDCEQISFVPLARKYKGQVAFFAVASNNNDLGAAKTDPGTFGANVGTHGLPYNIVLDPSHRVADALGAVITPQTFLVDPQNHIVFSGAPDDSWQVKRATGRPGATKRYLADALEQALSGATVKTPSVKSLGCSIER